MTSDRAGAGGPVPIALGHRPDLTADCGSCVGLCCVALAFARSADFPVDKPAGEPCRHLDPGDRCTIHTELRPRGYRGCTVFDCFGAGQQVARVTFAGRSWRADPATRTAMFATFPVMRRLHELLWYLEQSVDLIRRAPGSPDAAAWTRRVEHVRSLTGRSAADLLTLDVDAEYDAARPLLVRASDIARTGVPPTAVRHRGRPVGPGDDLAGARLRRADLTGACLRGALLIGADLRGARLDRCDVLGVDWRDADLSGADLRTAIYLTRPQLDGARGDAATRLPDGFRRPAHWSDTAADPVVPPGSPRTPARPPARTRNPRRSRRGHE